MDHEPELEGPLEIAIVGDLTDNESDLTEKLLGVAPGGECVIYFDSPGGSPYCAMSLMTLIRLRRIRATGVVTGECSSAALWPFAACERRIVTPYSVLLFHPMRWQSEENVGLAEAAEWARHFGQLEHEMDDLLGELFGVPKDLMAEWITPGRYVSGAEIAKAGMAELVPFSALHALDVLDPAPGNGPPGYGPTENGPAEIGVAAKGAVGSNGRTKTHRPTGKQRQN